jgi:hypothetical protein
MKRSLSVVSILFAAAVAAGSVRAIYRVDLRDGSHLLSLDSPVHRGSLVLFHLYPEGVLTSLPEEQVSRVRAEAESTGLKPLRPGEVVDVGVTSGHPAAAPAPVTPAATSPATIPGGVYDPRNPYYGYGGTYLPGGVLPGDLARAVTTEPPTAENPIAPNGFPAAPGVSPMIGPNGTPILGPASPPPMIGPNGTPILAPPGAPGSTPGPIGSNGYPIR